MITKRRNSGLVAIIMMITLLGMIGFVTNLAAPVGTIWKNQYEDSNFLGMLGNLMNFAAYAIMGIPSGKLLKRIGYKKTAICSIVIGVFGLWIQFISGIVGGNFGFAIYLFGAFTAGFSVCTLNTVANPMLNEIGGGGKRGGALLQAGGTCNSLLGTLAPIVVGTLIGEVTKKTELSDLNSILFIGMGIFALIGTILFCINIPEPSVTEQINGSFKKYSAWSFRHFVLGAIGIFIYVGVEVGIPGTVKFFLEEKGILPAAAGTIASIYWFLMLLGRLFGTVIANKVSSRILLAVTSGTAAVLVLLAICIPSSVIFNKMPIFDGSSFVWDNMPSSTFFLVLIGLCTSVMWGSIFNLAVEGLGQCLAEASGIYMMMVAGGGVVPLVQNWIIDITDKNYMLSFWVPFLGFSYLFYYALIGSKNVNKNVFHFNE